MSHQFFFSPHILDNLIGFNISGVKVQVMENSNIVIYETSDCNQVEVKLENNTVWATQQQIAAIFGVGVPAISKHIKNIYKDGELAENATISKMETVVNRGFMGNVTHTLDIYNLDMVVSIGYRVNSKKATAFRIWATNILKKYMTQGYVINERQMVEYKDKFETLQKFIGLLERTAVNQIENLDPVMRDLLDVAAKFADGFAVLDGYDHEELATRGVTKRPAAEISVDEFLAEIKKMTAQFGGLFGLPKDESFASSIGQIYQSFDGRELYPSIEEKAATLLYLVTKNHSFVDGNKRIAAFCFIYFLAKNNLLFIDGRKIIDDAALASLTLLVAQSDPKEMDTIKRVIITILNKCGE